MRRFAPLLAVPLALAACTASTAKPARQVGMVASIGGVVGMTTSAALSGQADTMPFLNAFSLVSLVGIGLYAAGELTDPRFEVVQETRSERHARWARILTERCFRYAREGNCKRVRRVEPRVAFYDPAFHDIVFMKDEAIAKCFAPVDDDYLKLNPSPQSE